MSLVVKWWECLRRRGWCWPGKWLVVNWGGGGKASQGWVVHGTGLDCSRGGGLGESMVGGYWVSQGVVLAR